MFFKASVTPVPHYWRFHDNGFDIILVMNDCPLEIDKELTSWAKRLVEADVKPLDASGSDSDGILYLDVPRSQFTKAAPQEALYRVYLPPEPRSVGTICFATAGRPGM